MKVSRISLKSIVLPAIFAIAGLLASCTELSSPVVSQLPSSAGGPGQSDTSASLAENSAMEATQNKIRFSGYNWFVRSSGYSGPGLNLFSNRMSNVWVDADGNLHLKITYYKGKWYSAEIYSEDTFGYGEYSFYVSSQVDKLDKNVVLGLFTWNNNSFQSDANSEIDIEFAKWGLNTGTSLEYSVQPTSWDGYKERFYYPPNYSMTGNYSTHTFRWSPAEVKFRSYYDHGNPTPWLAGQWSFLQSAGTRRKTEGGNTSDPVGIPKPGTQTHVHLNLWLHDSNRDGFGDAPSDGQEVEVLVKKFEFTAI